MLRASVSAPQAGHVHTPRTQTRAKTQIKKAKKDRKENGIRDIKIYRKR